MKYFAVLMAFVLGCVSVLSAIEWPEGFYQREDIKWLMEYWNVKLPGSQTVHNDEIFSEDSLSQAFDLNVKRCDVSGVSTGGKRQVFDVLNPDGEKVATCLVEAYDSHEAAVLNYFIRFSLSNMSVQDAVELYELKTNGIGQICLAANHSYILNPDATNRFLCAIHDNIYMSLEPNNNSVNVEKLLSKMDSLLLSESDNQNLIESSITQEPDADADVADVQGSGSEGETSVVRNSVTVEDKSKGSEYRSQRK